MPAPEKTARDSPLPCPICRSPASSGGGPCETCAWAHGPGIPEDDPRYLVMFTLVQRAVDASTHMKGDSWSVFLRIRPGAREYALLEENDLIVTGGIYWRITEKDYGAFWMRGSEVSWSEADGLRLKNPVDKSEPEWIRKLREKIGY